MASIQKMSSLGGHRIYWRLHFPDGTFHEKYKASKKKAYLQGILPDVMKTETLSERCELTVQDLARAVNMRIITREEMDRFGLSVALAEAHTLEELRPDYEIQSKARSSSQHCHSCELYKGDILERHFREPLSEITPEAIERYLAGRRQTMKASTVNGDLKALRKYLDIAVSKGWLRENPARKVKLLREPRSRIPRCLYPDEIQTYFEGMKAYAHWLHGEFEFIIKCLIYTGLRRGELCNLRPEDVKLDLRQIHLLGKGQKYRIVGIHEELIEDFDQRIKRGFILNKETRPESISRAFKRVARALGLSKDLTLHSLRHSYISYLLHGGIPASTVKERAGHFSLAITDRYTHAIPSDAAPEDVLNFTRKKG